MNHQKNTSVKPDTGAVSAFREESGLLDAADVGVIVFLLDEALSILQANASFYTQTGYSKEEYQNRFPSLQHYYIDFPDEFLSVKTKLSNVWKLGKRNTRSTIRIPQKSGNASWMRIAAAITKEVQDGYLICYMILMEVDELMQQREDFRRLYQNKSYYFEWMMNEYAGNIYIADTENHQLLYLNQTACQTLGHSLEDVYGKKCYEVLQGRTAPCPFCTNDKLTEDAFYEWEFDNLILHRTFMIKNRLIQWKGHKARFELSHDMYSTEFKLAKKDQERDAIIRTIPGGFARIDARDNRTILWYGGGFLQIIGYTEEQFKTELHGQCAYVHPNDIDRATNIMESAKKKGRDTISETRIITRDGEIKYLTTTFSYVSSEESWDGIPSFYSVGIDVTKEREEQARQQKALEDAFQSAQVASAAKTNFLSSMSHDIRTPMNAIMGMTAIAKANLHSPEKLRDCLNKIDTSNQHLLHLINEVLDMSKIESGKIDLTLDKVKLPDLVQNITDMCQPFIAEKKQQFQISIGRLQHECVIADGDRLQQILMNLLSNAIKYTPEGGTIALRINELFSPVHNQGQFEFICTDNGIGMPEEFMPHVFEPFTRANDPQISREQGTGLGMAITNNIVHMMNGTITVHSEIGKGSTFTVSIPLALCTEKEMYSNELIGLSVLVVDDDPITCESAAALLSELGIRTAWVTSKEEALCCMNTAHQQQDDFSAVILDWKMPKMDGLETLKAIREQLHEEVPIIIISAYDYSDIEEEFLSAGADAFITKPLFKSRMMHILNLFISEDKENIDLPVNDTSKLPANLAGKRILLAEDNDINREIAVELLQIYGIIADTVENGQRAVEVFLASAPGYYDAILMDIQMPVMNGYDATEAIRTTERKDAKTIPILALTANAFSSDIGKARGSGMNDHIAKPIDAAYLLEILQKWLC